MKVSLRRWLSALLKDAYKNSLTEVCLLRQLYIRDEDMTVEKLLLQNIGAIGENIVIRRFARWELGEQTAG